VPNGDSVVSEAPVSNAASTEPPPAEVIAAAVTRTTPGQIVLGSACLALFGYAVAISLVPSLWLGLMLGLVMGAMPYLVLRFIRGRRLGKFEEQFPEAVDLLGRLEKEERAAGKQHQVAPGNLLAERGEDRRCQADEPKERQQEDDAEAEGHQQADLAGPLGLLRRQLADDYRDEDDVVDSEDDLENRKCDEAGPDGWIADPVEKRHRGENPSFCGGG